MFSIAKVLSAEQQTDAIWEVEAVIRTESTEAGIWPIGRFPLYEKEAPLHRQPRPDYNTLPYSCCGTLSR